MSLNTIRAMIILNAKKGWSDEARKKAALTRKAKTNAAAKAGAKGLKKSERKKLSYEDLNKKYLRGEKLVEKQQNRLYDYKAKAQSTWKNGKLSQARKMDAKSDKFSRLIERNENKLHFMLKKITKMSKDPKEDKRFLKEGAILGDSKAIKELYGYDSEVKSVSGKAKRPKRAAGSTNNAKAKGWSDVARKKAALTRKAKGKSKTAKSKAKEIVLPPDTDTKHPLVGRETMPYKKPPGTKPVKVLGVRPHGGKPGQIAVLSDGSEMHTSYVR